MLFSSFFLAPKMSLRVFFIGPYKGASSFSMLPPFIFYWRITALQYHCMVSAIHQHESAAGRHVPPLVSLPPSPSSSYPSRLSQSTGLSSLCLSILCSGYAIIHGSFWCPAGERISHCVLAEWVALDAHRGAHV